MLFLRLHIIKTLAIFILAITFVGCKKPVESSFITYEDDYYAGDTIHLINKSINAKTYSWHLPDGSISSNVNVEYLVDKKVIFQPLPFELNASTKHGTNESTSAKLLVATLKPKVPLNNYSMGPYKNEIRKGPNNYGTENNCHYIQQTDSRGSSEMTISIYFPGTAFDTPPGIYTLQPNNNSLTSNQAHIKMRYYCYDCSPPPNNMEFYESISGQLVVTYNSKGELRAIFNDASVRVIDTTNTVINVCGNLTFLNY